MVVTFLVSPHLRYVYHFVMLLIASKRAPTLNHSSCICLCFINWICLILSPLSLHSYLYILSIIPPISIYFTFLWFHASKLNFFHVFWLIIMIFLLFVQLLFLRVYVSTTITWCCSPRSTISQSYPFEVWTYLLHLPFNHFSLLSWCCWVN